VIGSLSERLIRRPITTILLMVALVIMGVVGYARLPISDLPSIDFPTLQVNVSLPGASPTTMATSVATPLEQQFSSIAGIAEMSSSSAQGSSQITLQFNLGRDIDAAAQDVQTAISQAARQLPADLPNPPRFARSIPLSSRSCISCSRLICCPSRRSPRWPRYGWPSGFRPSMGSPRCSSMALKNMRCAFALIPRP
jgi:multidrug efflux pump subunit AcrB